MQDRRFRIVAVALFGLIAVAAGGWALWTPRPSVDDAQPVPRPPRISPDYAGIVMPPNIAPLHFSIREPGSRFLVRIRPEVGPSIEIAGRLPAVVIPAAAWRRLLESNRGREVATEVFLENDGRWQRYEPIVNRVAEEEIDRWLVYRSIGPIYAAWRKVSIRQRDLGSFEDSVVLDAAALAEGCANCHTFRSHAPEPMLLGVRSKRFGNATLLVEGGKVEKLAAMLGTPAWHPGGRIVVYVTARVHQFFHAAGEETRDAINWDGDLACYRVDARQAVPLPWTRRERRLRDYPAWTPDGRWLYYSSAPILWTDRRVKPPPRYAEVKYDLMRIGYDAEKDAWGEPQTVLSAETAGQSVLMPRISPDGRFLLFCMCRYGSFPAFQASSDLYLMDLATGAYSKAEASSPESESWHSWSSNSRWIVFSSKREGGILTRCFVSYVDREGRTHKPILLPQRDPAHYQASLGMVSLPELLASPITVGREALERTAQSDAAVGPSAGPSAADGSL